MVLQQSGGILELIRGAKVGHLGDVLECYSSSRNIQAWLHDLYEIEHVYA